MLLSRKQRPSEAPLEEVGKRHRRRGLRLLIPAVFGGVAVAKIARHRRAQEQDEQTQQLADELSEPDAPAAAPTRPEATKSPNARTPESATR